MSHLRTGLRDFLSGAVQPLNPKHLFFPPGCITSLKTWFFNVSCLVMGNWVKLSQSFLKYNDIRYDARTDSKFLARFKECVTVVFCCSSSTEAAIVLELFEATMWLLVF